MKIAVIGGTGFIGSKLVERLGADGHEVVIAARATGVNSFTGEGLEAALSGVETVIDTSNSDYFDDSAATEFFYASTLNLLTYGAAAGVKHHVALSVVGTDRLAASEGGYFKAKEAQEKLIRNSGKPYTIVHSTQFFEFVKSIADAATVGKAVRLSHAFIQPIAGDDVALALSSVAVGAPVNGMIEIAGPDIFRLEEIVRTELRLRQDRREVVADPLARYFGTELDERELLPENTATIARTTFAEWLNTTQR